MLMETDPRVTAYINLYAVLGTLPLLVERVPEARAILAGITKPTTIHFRVAGGPRDSLTFTRDAVRPGREPKAAAVVRDLVTTKGEKSKEMPDLVVGKKKYKMDLIPPDLMAEFRAAAQDQRKPVSRAGAVVIVAIWLACTAIAGWIAWSMLAR